MFKPIISLSFLIILLPLFGVCQDVIEDIRNNSRLHLVHDDARLDSLMARQSRIDATTPIIKGYRVQIFSGSGNSARENANQLRSEFLQIYPDVPAHLIFQQPNFKVRLGDLRTELEAIRLKKEIGYDYPNGFVVRDMIDLPRLPIEEVEEVEDEENEE